MPKHSLYQCWLILLSDHREQTSVNFKSKCKTLIVLEKNHLKMSSTQWWPFCSGLSVSEIYIFWFLWSAYQSQSSISSVALTILIVSSPLTAIGRYWPILPWEFKSMFFRLTMQNSSLDIRCEIVLRWLTQNLTNDKSTLVQVMAWCHQATSHYLNHCWPRSMSPYGVTRR